MENKRKKRSKAFIKFAYSFYPTLLMSSVLLFIVFMIIGFCLNNEIASNVMFALSFACLILYIPSFLFFSRLQKSSWYKECARCKNLKRINKQKIENALRQLDELKKHFNMESDKKIEK